MRLEGNQTYRSQGLLDQLPEPRTPHPNRVPPEIEKDIMDYSLEFPTHGYIERMHRTLLDEHFRIKGREKYFESLFEM